MKYCFLSTGSWKGNASFVRLRELGIQLASRGHHVSYVLDDVPYNHEDLGLPPEAHLEFVPKGNLLKELWGRRKAIARIAPDHVHVLNPYIKAFAALAGTRVKVVGDWDEWPARRPYPFLKKCEAKFLDHWLRTRSTHVILASRYLQKEFKRIFNREAAYIPYATYLTPRDAGESPFTEPTAVYMGNLYSAYDHDLIIEAAMLLKKRGLTPPVRILGSGPDLEKWHKYVSDQGLENVQLPGFVSGDLLWANLSHAHVLLFPIRETLLNLSRCPSKTFAYAQTGRPIIANPVGEVKEVLKDKAIWVEPTPQAFADALESVFAASPAPLIDYQVDQQNWSARCASLLETLNSPNE